MPRGKAPAFSIVHDMHTADKRAADHGRLHVSDGLSQVTAHLCGSRHNPIVPRRSAPLVSVRLRPRGRRMRHRAQLTGGCARAKSHGRPRDDTEEDTDDTDA